MPSQAAPTQSATLSSTLAAPASQRPAWRRTSVSTENVENVVNAPSRPVMRRRRISGGTWTRSAKRANSHPITKDPATLTTRVPRGKRAPKAAATAFEIP